MLQKKLLDFFCFLLAHARWLPLAALVAIILYFGLPNIFGGLQGSYFEGTNFEKLLYQRKDRVFYFASTHANRGEGFPQKNFSVRWHGEIYCPEDGLYHFGMVSDDGVRLLLNDTPVIDYWKTTRERNHEGHIELKQGWNRIQLDFFQAQGSWMLKLFWSPPGRSMSLIPPRALRTPNSDQ